LGGGGGGCVRGLGNLEKNNEQMLAITKKGRKKLIAEEIDRET